jgi:PAS domain S-box-containing protein
VGEDVVGPSIPGAEPGGVEPLAAAELAALEWFFCDDSAAGRPAAAGRDPRRALDVLQARERQLRLITDATPALMSYVDRDRRYRFVNRQYETWFGYRHEELIGRTLAEVLGEAVMERLEPYVERALRGEDVRFEMEAPYRQGGVRWIDAHYVPDRDGSGGVAGFFVLVSDISERKKAELSLTRRVNEQAALYRFTDRLHYAGSLVEVFDAALDSILSALGCDRASMLLFDEAGMMRFVAWRGLSDRYRQAVEGHSPWGPGERNPQPITMDDIAASDLAAPLKEVVTGEGIGAFAFIPLVGDGRLIGKFMIYYDAAHAFTEEEVDLALTIGRQLAFGVQRKRAEEERARAEGALREADRRKDEFLATLAHELRNPLAPIRNALHLLRLTGGSGPAADRIHEMMERQVGHMVRLVDDLLEVSRITRGKIELRKERVELAAVVRNAVETSRPLVEAARHDLSVSVSGEPVIVEADPVRLAQVVSNLLNNAAKYTDEGGRIAVCARREGGDAVVAIRDSGAGIPEDMLPRIFEMFTQVDRTLGRAAGGLGIGLALTRSVVEMHGGRVEARSDGPGRGSEFVVRLPLAAAEDPAADGGARDGVTPAALAPRRILAVDDNRDAADSMGMLLRFLGADVQVVYDGPAALGAIGSCRPEVILLDIDMPGMDGYEVARRLRQDPRLGDAILIALSGWGQEDDRRRAREAGFDHHLVKPVDPGRLMQILRSTLPEADLRGRSARGALGH